MGKLILMSGVPGSGKSWWCKNKLPELEENVLYISRDEIRFSMLNDGEEYFSKEKAYFFKYALKYFLFIFFVVFFKQCNYSIAVHFFF